MRCNPSECAIYELGGGVFKKVPAPRVAFNTENNSGSRSDQVGRVARVGEDNIEIDGGLDDEDQLEIVYTGKWFLKNKTEIWDEIIDRKLAMAGSAEGIGHGGDWNSNCDDSAQNALVVDFMSVADLRKLRGESN